MRYPLLLTIILIFLVSCNPGDNGSSKPVITVSILPQQYFLEQLAGDLVDVNVLIPPGASPATYEPTISQLRMLDQSEIYMRIGYVGFELSWLPKIRTVNPDLKIIDLSRGIEPIRQLAEEETVADSHHSHNHDHGSVDPHIWMSAQNAIIIAGNIYHELLLLFPDKREELQSRFSRMETALDSLHLIITELLAGQEKKSFMIYHPALSYFAKDYNLEQYPLELEGKTPSPAHLREMTDLGVEKGITTIFIQAQFDRNNAEVLAREIGATIVQIDPLDTDWHGQMIYIAEQLSASFAWQSPS